MKSTLKQTLIAMASAAIGCGGATGATDIPDRGEYLYDYGARGESVCGAEPDDPIEIDLNQIEIVEERASEDVLVTCAEAEQTRDTICELSDRICRRATVSREPNDAARCEEGKAHCVVAQANVEDC